MVNTTPRTGYEPNLIDIGFNHETETTIFDPNDDYQEKASLSASGQSLSLISVTNGFSHSLRHQDIINFRQDLFPQHLDLC